MRIEKILKVFIFISLCMIFCTGFSINPTKLTFSLNNKSSSGLEIGKAYKLEKKIEKKESETIEKIEMLAKKITYLLVGEPYVSNETSEQYYSRKQAYFGLIYTPDLPESDQSSIEYKRKNLASFVGASMFKNIAKHKIEHKGISDIKVITDTEDDILCRVILEDIVCCEKDEKDPMEFKKIKSTLALYYCFTKHNDDWKVYYILGDISDEYEERFTDSEEENVHAAKIVDMYDSDLKNIYDFSAAERITDYQINTIEEKNKENMVVLNSYYNNYLVASANGFFINKGLVVTTWDYLKTSLSKAQYIAIKDMNGDIREMEGIVVVNPDTDIAVIKMKELSKSFVTLGESSSLKKEEAVLTMTSRTGVGITIQKGIVLSSGDYIESVSSLRESDRGSMLLNLEGNICGMITSKSVNTDTSTAINTVVLKEIQDKFGNMKFDKIECISFDKLKSECFYEKTSKEKVEKNIRTDKWKKISKVGNLTENIKLKLVKSSYSNGVYSIRYYNGIRNFITNMQLAHTFKQELKKQGYSTRLESEEKCIYEGKNYKVIIMSEFNYLIIVMVEL